MKRILKVIVIALCLTMAALLVAPVNGRVTVKAATKVKINCTKKTIYEGDSFKLKISGTTKRVKWSSSNRNVATVSSKGVVRGIDGGTNKKTCKITASVDGKRYVCKVTIRGSKLNETSLIFEEDENRDLWIIGNKQNIEWSSEDESVATVVNGKVTGKSAGKTVIIAKTNTKTYKCDITITKKILIEDFSVQNTLTMRAGENVSISVTPIPTNATEKFLPVYTSDDTNIVVISQNGMITAITSGQTQISVSFKDIKKTITVIVQKTKLELLQDEEERYIKEKQSLQDEYTSNLATFKSELNTLLLYGGYYLGTEYDYQNELSEATKKVSNCQKLVDIYSGDDSDEGQARLRKAKSDLVSAQNAYNELIDKWERLVRINTLKESIKGMDDKYKIKLDEIERNHQQNISNIQAQL